MKQLLEGDASWKPGGVGFPIYRDQAPEGVGYPYIVITEGISKTPIARGDNGANDALREMVQLDIVQARRNPDGSNAEVYGVADAVGRSVHGKRLVTAPNIVYGTQLFSSARQISIDNNYVLDSLSVVLNRKI